MISRTWTTVYGVASAIAFGAMLMLPTSVRVPWYMQLSMYFYVFLSAGFICIGRIAGRKQQQAQLDLIMRQSEENKRRMN